MLKTFENSLPQNTLVWIVSLQNLYVKSETPDVTVVGDQDFMR